MADPVETFRRFILLILKWIAICVAFLICLAAVAGGAYYCYHYFTYLRHAEAVEIKVVTGVCTDPKYPLLVAIKNGSTRKIESVRFTLEARHKGYSSNIAYWDSYTDDRIRNPSNETSGTCWKAPLRSDTADDPKNLDWSISSVTYTFGD